MRIAVTGASGFVGRHVLALLCEAGHDAYGIVGPTKDSRWAVDVTNVEGVRAVLQSCHPEAVLHLAGQSSVAKSWKAPGTTVAANTVGTLNTWMAAIETGVRRFVFASSAEIYDPQEALRGPLSETAAISPHNPYGLSKHWAEEALRQLATNTSVEVVVIRAFNHIGPGQAPGFVAADFVRQILMLKGGAISVLRVGDLTPTRDFLDVRDVARAYQLALETPSLVGTYNVCSGYPRTIASLMEGLCRAAGIPCSTKVDPNLVRPIDAPTLVGDPRRLRDATGWVPRYSWERTLRDIWWAGRVTL